MLVLSPLLILKIFVGGLFVIFTHYLICFWFIRSRVNNELCNQLPISAPRDSENITKFVMLHPHEHNEKFFKAQLIENATMMQESCVKEIPV